MTICETRIEVVSEHGISEDSTDDPEKIPEKEIPHNHDPWHISDISYEEFEYTGEHEDEYIIFLTSRKFVLYPLSVYIVL